mmetsp:Transcript_15751/g.29746  ORF Transcript_15751/g.29746 Transcript_15751/m.29746 type:complete len:139 (-) Transcript_15751:114-530(-)
MRTRSSSRLFTLRPRYEPTERQGDERNVGTQRKDSPFNSSIPYNLIHITPEKINQIKIQGKMDPAVKARLVADVQFLDRLYPKHCIDLVFVDEDFDAASVERLAAYYKIPNNRMFIACPSKGFKDTVATLGGVRVITH